MRVLGRILIRCGTIECWRNAAILARAADRQITITAPSGGVAERLIAPVLKTGRPKGLVSSNLTPSANPNSAPAHDRAPNLINAISDHWSAATVPQATPLLLQYVDV
jgi:hypothetical protein